MKTIEKDLILFIDTLLEKQDIVQRIADREERAMSAWADELMETKV